LESATDTIEPRVKPSSNSVGSASTDNEVNIADQMLSTQTPPQIHEDDDVPALEMMRQKMTILIVRQKKCSHQGKVNGFGKG
jgi:hypothetical protein